MSDFLAKLKVIVTALPTYLTIVAAAVPIILTQWVPLLPDNVAAYVAAIGAGVVAVAAATIETIRRLTPVIKEDRGLLADPPVVPEVNVEG